MSFAFNDDKSKLSLDVVDGSNDVTFGSGLSVFNGTTLFRAGNVVTFYFSASVTDVSNVSIRVPSGFRPKRNMNYMVPIYITKGSGSSIEHVINAGTFSTTGELWLSTYPALANGDDIRCQMTYICS